MELCAGWDFPLPTLPTLSLAKCVVLDNFPSSPSHALPLSLTLSDGSRLGRATDNHNCVVAANVMTLITPFNFPLTKLLENKK